MKRIIIGLLSVLPFLANAQFQGAKFNDNGTLPPMRIAMPAKGIAASQSVTNYAPASVDSVYYKFSTTPIFTAIPEFGGWLAPSTSGDSIQTTAPFWVVIGDSQAEGHPNRHGRLHPGGLAAFNPTYPDSPGQLSYHLRLRTNMRWYNHGIGGQTSTQVRARFMRDVLGLNSNPNDSRGTQTLLQKPQGVVIIAGVNDLATGSDPSVVQDNLTWMAAICQEFGIRCVVLNIPGDAITNAAMLKGTATVNVWLAAGALDQFGACVVDYNKWWNDPAFGYDNVHHTSLIFDDIHPTIVGYDSLSAYIVRSANLPVLTRAVFINELNPGGFSGYSRPAGITINSTPYTLSRSTDTINISSFVPDSVWIRVTSSTNITGTSFSGFSHILWLSENNPTNKSYYTSRTLYSGSNLPFSDISKLTIRAKDFNGDVVFQILDNNNSPVVRISQGASFTSIWGGTAAFNDPNNTTATHSFNGSIGVQNGLRTGLPSIFGQLMAGNTGAPNATGWGIGVYNGSVNIEGGAAGTQNSPVFRFNKWNGFTPQFSANNLQTGVMFSQTGWGSVQTADTLWQYYMNPNWNHTVPGNSAFTRGYSGGLFYDPVVTAMGQNKLLALGNRVGDNVFNTSSGKTIIGAFNPVAGTGKLEVNSTTTGFIPPRMTTAQRDAMGYVSSISGSGGTGFTTLPTVSFSGGTGSGARANLSLTGPGTIVIDLIDKGEGYGTTTAPTVVLTGGVGGSGAAFTAVLHGPDAGTTIFNTTTNTLQVFDGTVWENYTSTFGQGTSTQSGNGSTTAFTIAHGLTGITSANLPFVNAQSSAAAGSFFVTVDATNITITYLTAPASGSSNLKWDYRIN